MTTEQQDIEVFESLGWKYLPPIERDNSFIVRLENLPRWKKGRHIAYKDDIPSYGTDLNAMHEAEKTLNDTHLWNRYRGWLLTWMTEPICATAAQRREAFLRTIGKYND